MFARSLPRFGFPPVAAEPMALLIVLLEFSLVPLVLLPSTSRVALSVALLFLVMTSLLLVRELYRGDLAPCMCFGQAHRPLGPRPVVRNGLTVLLALCGLSATTVPGVGRALVLACAGIVIGLALVYYEEFADLVMADELRVARR